MSQHAPATPEWCRTFTIPLGVMDVEVSIFDDGEVGISPSLAEIPSRLHAVVRDVIETWAIDFNDEDGSGLTGPPGEVWHELFGHRFGDAR